MRAKKRSMAVAAYECTTTLSLPSSAVHGCSSPSSVCGGNWLRNTVTNLSASAQHSTVWSRTRQVRAHKKMGCRVGHVLLSACLQALAQHQFEVCFNHYPAIHMQNNTHAEQKNCCALLRF